MRLVFLERDPMFIGGSERMSLALCRHAISRGHQAWLVHAGTGDMVAAYAAAGATCLHLPVRPIAVRRPVEAFTSLVNLVRVVRREHIDIIVTSLVSYVSLLAAVGKWTGARTAVHLGLTYDFPSPVFRAGMRGVDLGITPSPHTADGWRARDWPERSLRVIPNGVDTSTFFPGQGQRVARERMGLTQAQQLVGYVGRLVPEKGIFTLLKAFARYHRGEPTAQLLFVGAAPGGEVEQLRRVAREERVPDDAWRVHDATATPEDIYRAADIVVCPSEWDEPFGLVPLESTACGTLTVVSDRGVLPDLVGSAGEQAVFPSGDVDALANRLHFWLSDRHRREDAARRQGEDTRARFGFERCGDAYLASFQAVLAS